MVRRCLRVRSIARPLLVRCSFGRSFARLARLDTHLDSLESLVEDRQLGKEDKGLSVITVIYWSNDN